MACALGGGGQVSAVAAAHMSCACVWAHACAGCQSPAQGSIGPRSAVFSGPRSALQPPGCGTVVCVRVIARRVWVRLPSLSPTAVWAPAVPVCFLPLLVLRVLPLLILLILLILLMLVMLLMMVLLLLVRSSVSRRPPSQAGWWLTSACMGSCPPGRSGH
jgi:hypothetical protein